MISGKETAQFSHKMLSVIQGQAFSLFTRTWHVSQGSVRPVGKVVNILTETIHSTGCAMKVVQGLCEVDCPLTVVSKSLVSEHFQEVKKF